MSETKNGLKTRLGNLGFKVKCLESLDKYMKTLTIDLSFSRDFLKKYTLYLIKCLENLDT